MGTSSRTLGGNPLLPEASALPFTIEATLTFWGVDISLSLRTEKLFTPSSQVGAEEPNRMQGCLGLTFYTDATPHYISLFSCMQHAGNCFMIWLRTCRSLQLRGSRYFSLTSNVRSGHNRWSKIKHDKAKTDVCARTQTDGRCYFGRGKRLTTPIRPR